jgi:hypothetical protein
MRQLKHHAVHMLMCAPMLIVAVIAIASGATFATLIPVLGCVAMMTLMMGAMHGAGNRRDGDG